MALYEYVEEPLPMQSHNALRSTNEPTRTFNLYPDRVDLCFDCDMYYTHMRSCRLIEMLTGTCIMYDCRWGGGFPAGLRPSGI